MKHTWVEVRLDLLRRNIEAVRGALGRVEIIFVVKANAYGHGLVPVSRSAAAAGIRWFAVAHVHEAVELRRSLPRGHILILGPTEPSDVPVLMAQRLVPVVLNAEHGRQLAASAAPRRLPVHLKIDTGMGRLGIPWFAAPEILAGLLDQRGLEILGLCTHFATIDPLKPGRAQVQMKRFAEVDDWLADRLGRRLFRHISSSRALLYHQEWDCDGVRPGILLYGYGAKDPALRVRTEPILQWKARVIQVKAVPEKFSVGYYNTYTTETPTEIATVSVGYADGFQRHLGNRGHVLIRGRRHPVVGRVSMNWITVDVGADSGVQPGDEVVLLGVQGQESIWADEVSRQCQTIAYEILTGINPLAERAYAE